MVIEVLRGSYILRISMYRDNIIKMIQTGVMMLIIIPLRGMTIYVVKGAYMLGVSMHNINNGFNILGSKYA